MNRRTLLQGILGASAALVLPPTIAENAEATRRYWTGYGAGRWDDHRVFADEFARWQETARFDASMTDWSKSPLAGMAVRIVDYAFGGSLDWSTAEIGVLMPNGMFYTSMQSEGVYVELAR